MNGATRFPQVPAYSGNRLRWPGALLAASCLFSNANAQGDDWREFALLVDGSTWAYRAASLGRVNGWVVADLQRSAQGTATAYKGMVRAEHCGARRGDVKLLDATTGEEVSSAVFIAGSNSLPAAIAATLCTALQKART